MRVFGILFFFLFMAGLSDIWSENPASNLDYPAFTPNANSHSNPSIQESSSFDFGAALPTSFIPERPVVRSVRYFPEGQNFLENIFGLFAILETIECNYLKLSQAIDTGLPVFFIVFPHHYFT